MIDTNPAFKRAKEAVTKRVDYLSLMNATGVDDLSLRFPAQMEVAVTGEDLDFLRNLDLTVVVRDVLLATEVQKSLLTAVKHIPTPIVHARQTVFSNDRMMLLLSSRRFGFFSEMLTINTSNRFCTCQRNTTFREMCLRTV